MEAQANGHSNLHTETIRPWMRRHSQSETLLGLVLNDGFWKRIKGLSSRSDLLVDSGMILKRFKDVVQTDQKICPSRTALAVKALNEQAHIALFYLSASTGQGPILQRLVRAASVDWSEKPRSDLLEQHNIIPEKHSVQSHIEAGLVTALRQSNPDLFKRLLKLFPEAQFDGQWCRLHPDAWSKIARSLNRSYDWSDGPVQALIDHGDYEGVLHLHDIGFDLPPNYTREMLEKRLYSTPTLGISQARALPDGRAPRIGPIPSDIGSIWQGRLKWIVDRYNKRAREIANYVTELINQHNCQSLPTDRVPLYLSQLHETSVTFARPDTPRDGTPTVLTLPLTQPIACRVNPPATLTVESRGVRQDWRYHPDELFAEPDFGQSILQRAGRRIARYEQQYLIALLGAMRDHPTVEPMTNETPFEGLL